MTNYISLEAALQMIENAYLASVVLLLAVSYFGLSGIERLEKSPESSPFPRYFK